jgi:KUP system potassium uptake protein
LVALATAATVIASQSVISGAFSLTRQAIQLGYMPQLDIHQTSAHAHGQIYVPQVNWLLLVSVLALVLGFESSSALADAYGFAVTGTMVATTLLAGSVLRGVWRWHWPLIAIVLLPLLAVDLALFSANVMKIPTGGWFPLVMGALVFLVMSTWRVGRQLVLRRLTEGTVPLREFLAGCDTAPEARVSGTAAFLTGQTDNVPLTLLHNLRHNKVLHRQVLLVRLVTESIPWVAPADRVRVTDLEHGFWRVELHFGFAETPDVPRALRLAAIPGFDADPRKISFFVGRANIKPTDRPGMALWRERLYAVLTRLATRPTEFVRIPADRVIEIGAEVEI